MEVTLVFIGSAIALGIVPLLQLLGKLPPGNANFISQRLYLFLPHPAGLLLWGLAGPLSSVLGQGAALALFAVGLLMMFVGVVLWIWGPKRLRPRWQKEYMAEMGYDGPEAQEAARRRSRGEA